MLQFLDHLYHQGLGYSALNTARSAISSVSSILCGEKFGDNPLVRRFLKGVFNLRPSLPRYVFTWNPETVLKHLDVDSSKLNILELSRKVVFLVALLSGQRLSTIANLKYSDVKINGSTISIAVGVVKQTRPGFSQKPISFQKFSEKPHLCVFTQLQQYLDRTKCFRAENQSLFLTTVKPIHAASINTLSNWVRFILNRCNLSQFSPHSLRGAGTSAAHRSCNFPVDAILSAAGWTQESTFQKFYARPIVDNTSLDVAILNSQCFH